MRRPFAHAGKVDCRAPRETQPEVLVEKPSPRIELPSPHSRARFGALAYREFRLLWFGLLVSNTGSWMQMLAQGWLVVELAPSATLGAFYLGMVGFVRAMPVFLLSGLAGALADRVDRRRLLFYTNFTMGASALVLGCLAALHVVQIWQVMIVAAASSAAAAFDAPTRQSLVPHLVAPRELMNAIGLNSAAFNGPAIIGPAIGGVIVGAFGVATCFFLNAASYLAVVLALILMSPKPPVPVENRPGIWQEMTDGFHYMRRDPRVVGVIALSALFALVCRPYIQLMPAFAKAVVHVGPRELGVLMAAAGAGALAGSVAVAIIRIHHRRGALLIVSASVAGIMLGVLGLTRSLLLASASLVVLGAAVMLFMGMANTLLQVYTALPMRGRVMSIYTMLFLGMMPLGTWLLGSAASLTSLPASFAAGGALVVAAALVSASRRSLRELA